MTDSNPQAAVRVFAAGSAGCVADLVTFPLDTAKVRLQIQGEGRSSPEGQTVKYRGVFGTIVTIVRTEGPRSLYNGLVAGLQRQMTFASVRIGLYDSMKQLYAGSADNAGLGTRLLAGCTTGAMAVAFAQPTDVVKVRFQAQVRLLESATGKRYSSTTQAYRTIVRDEGLRGLWKGITAKTIHAIVFNIPLPEFIYNMPCHFTAAFSAGLCTTVVASPVDVVKTRYMNSVPGQYGGALNCAATMLIKEGPTAFYKGFMPSFLRLLSWNIVMFVSYEQFKRGFLRLQNCLSLLML
uniref:Uncharacterized protein n=1 Tax=Oryzias latipes TaxID=8090 RepID=A0A3P9M2K3_ORYLA